MPCKPSHNWAPSICSCLYRVMICPVNDNPAGCKICFLHTAEIHRELCRVYGHNAMSEGTVRQWCRMFMMKSKVVSHLQLWWSCSKCWPKNLWKTALHNFRTFVWISTKFHALFSMRLSQLGYAIASFAQDGFKNVHRCAENGFTFDFFFMVKP
jgi:hypothetical protein